MGALSSAKAHATVAVSDMDRAMSFYRDTLGFTPVVQMQGATTFECGGGTLLDVYASEFAGSCRSTAASFEVTDLDAAMADLRGRGVVFETYDMGEIKTSDGVVEVEGLRGAWFKDPEGNILGLVQPG
jgi:catechol 2,3-dioxygenase-like lactoylglutathione lyase family enzyme